MELIGTAIWAHSSNIFRNETVCSSLHLNSNRKSNKKAQQGNKQEVGTWILRQKEELSLLGSSALFLGAQVGERPAGHAEP